MRTKEKKRFGRFSRFFAKYFFTFAGVVFIFEPFVKYLLGGYVPDREFIVFPLFGFAILVSNRFLDGGIRGFFKRNKVAASILGVLILPILKIVVDGEINVEKEL
jgi:hypothetical protein